MRIRTVKPEFWQDEDLAEISETARLVAIGLLNCADDEGFFNANERLVQSSLFPLTEPSLSVHECFNQLVECGYLKLYACVEGKKTYGHVVNFTKHQKVNRPSPSRIKPVVDFTEHSVRTHKQLTAGREQGTGNREQGKEHDSPSVEDDSFIPFDEFWSMYPKKVDKKAAAAKWKKLKINEDTFLLIRIHLDVAYSQTEKQFMPGPVVYLNGEKWNDEIITPSSSFQDNKHFDPHNHQNTQTLEQFNGSW